MFRTSRTVSRMRGPRSTRSPRKIALRPSGWAIDSGHPRADHRVSSRVSGSPDSSSSASKLIAAAVDIADDVERPVLVPLVVPERHPFNDGSLDFLGRLQHEDVTEALSLEPPQRPPQLPLLVADDVGPKSRSSRPALRSWQIRSGRSSTIATGRSGTTCQFHERLAGLGLDVGGVDHREPTQGEPLPGDEPEHLERMARDGLVVLVVARPSPGRRRTRAPRWP